MGIHWNQIDMYIYIYVLSLLGASSDCELAGTNLYTLLFWGKICFRLKFRSEPGRCICRPNMDLLRIGGIKKVVASTPLCYKWWSGRDGSLAGNVRRWAKNGSRLLVTPVWSGLRAHFLLILRAALIRTRVNATMMDLFSSSWWKMRRLVCSFNAHSLRS